jgi:hypothetical protein
MSRKQIADEARSAYLDYLLERGISLTLVVGTKEVVFKTVSGKTVRMPFANEKTKGYAWWWGLPNNDEFDYFILLGKSRAGEWLDFVLPYTFLSPIWAEIRPDKQGGVNFDIIDRGRGDYRLVLGKRLRPVNGFLGGIDPLR